MAERGKRKPKPLGGHYAAGHPDTARRLKAAGWSANAISNYFRVSAGTLKMWRHRYPRFKAAWFGEVDPGLTTDAERAFEAIEETEQPPQVTDAQRKRDVVELARRHMPEAVRTLVEIMRDPDVPAAARASAANTLIERGYGKPKQELEHTGADGGPIQTVDVSNMSNVERAQRLLAVLNRQDDRDEQDDKTAVRH